MQTNRISQLSITAAAGNKRVLMNHLAIKCEFLLCVYVCVCMCVSSACRQETINEGLQCTGQWKSGCSAWEEEQDRKEGGMKGWKGMKKKRSARGEEAQGAECSWNEGMRSECRSEELKSCEQRTRMVLRIFS